MPCYLTQKLELDMSKVDAAFVLAALRELDPKAALDGAYALASAGEFLRAGETVLFRDGKLQITARSTERTREIEEAVNRGVLNAIVKGAAKKFRWQLKPVKGKQYEYDAEKV